MLIWGTKRRTKKLGFAANFCPICREIKIFEIAALSMVSHIYFLPLGKGGVVGYTATCQACDIDLRVDPDTYSKFLKREPTSLLPLIQETKPDIHTEYADRLNIEDKLKKGQRISGEERKRLLKEPFEVISPLLERRYSESIPLDNTTARSCLLTVIIPFVFLCPSLLIGKYLLADILRLLAIAIGLAGVFISLGTMLTTHKRYLNQKIYPALASSLAPLQPTREELENILDHYRNLGRMSGEKLRVKKLINATQNVS